MKKLLETRSIVMSLFFHEREVWWCSVGINIGVETDGKNENFERPVLIVKKFNGHMLWVIPLTSKQREGLHYVKISHDRGVSFACVSQMKTMSSKRLLRKIGMIAESEFDAVCTRVIGYLKKSDPALGGVLGGRSH